MSTPVRLRHDSITAAEGHAKALRGEVVWACDCGQPTCSYHPETYQKVPPAEPGDAWRITWHRPDGEPEGPLAGFAICCPKCKLVHYWTSANNCASKRKTDSGAIVCDHTGKASCWTWTLAEDGTPLKAVASLFANGEGHCGYHGHLGDGGAPLGHLSDG